MLSYKEIQEIEKLETEIARLEYKQSQLRTVKHNSYSYERPDGELMIKSEPDSLVVTDNKEYQALESQIRTLKSKIESIKGREKRETAKERRAEEDRRMAYVEAHERYIEQSAFKRAIQTLTGKSFKAVSRRDNLTTEEIEGLYRR